MDDYIIEGFLKAAKPKCKGTESSPVGSPRQKSFCGRMCGHKKKNTKSETKGDPDSCINQALRRWKCRCAANDSKAILSVAETLLDGFIGNKTASESLDEESHKTLSKYVIFTKALYLFHQQNHWDSKRYGDHLLFERLYEDAQDLADDAAERVIGLCGSLLFTGAEGKLFQTFLPKEKSIKSMIESAIKIEEAFQIVCEITHSELKEKGQLSMGLDDLIMSQAGEGEVHLYLLKQTLDGLDESE